jgi:hypothetical protein
MTDMTKTFGEDFSKYNPRATVNAVTGNRDSITLEAYKIQVTTKLVNGQLSDFNNRPTEDPLKLIDDANSKTTSPYIGCALDKLTYSLNDARCPAGYTKWTLGDAATLKNGATAGNEYCIDASAYDQDFTARYPGGHCAAALGVSLNLLKTCATSLFNEQGTFDNGIYGSNPNTAAITYYDAMDSISTNYANLKTGVIKAAEVGKAMTGGID